ncbi:MBG domain-containing protein [Sulfitobacter geojensis]|uniref:two-partner secretion domain-containing protein n=1 Tax=Sulfitobacter geojensis TaxID=1342299 RepID=UPI002490A411|nr:MBG domain-containing protein [Sulfitobacter geojensis]
MTTCRTTTALASKAPSASKAGGRRFLRHALAFATALTPVWATAQDLPTGGTVVHGAATIATPNANIMVINQGSDRAVLNWDGFSVGAGSRVDINQPNANSAILNRVTGDTTSQIHGQINANGRVFVVNPNGIFIGATGSVNTGSFVASTLGIRTDDFVTGQTVFEGNGSSATVANEGNIQVVTGGYAALIGGKVKNSGTIQAPLGFVGLGSGERITLDLAGDGFLQVAVPTNSDDDGLEALIENSGTIQANGGTVQISAATARNAARQAINMSGVVEARTVSGRNGRITLGGGAGGSVKISGKVRTTARRPAIQVTQSARPALRPERGGDITVTGRDIALAGATIDASGEGGGGNIRIGGEYQGGPGLMTADTLSVDQGTTISADAYFNGDGGRVIAWSDLNTEFAGNIFIRGGASGGDGGFAEVSGKLNLKYAGKTNALAPNGNAGTLLLDPANIEIVSAAPVLNQIRDTDLEAQLALGNVIIQTDDANLPNPADYPDSVLGFAPQPGDLGDITVVTTASVAWTSGNTLQLIADNDIILNGPVTPNAGTLDLDATNRVVFNGAVSAVGGSVDVSAGADMTLAGSGSITASGGNVTVNADDIFIDGTFVAPSSTLNFNSNGNFNVSNPNVFDAASTSFTVFANDIALNRDIAVGSATVDITGDGSLSIGAAGSITGTGASVLLTSDGPINIDGPITMAAGDLSLRALGPSPITVSAGGDITSSQFRLIDGNYVQNALGGPLATFTTTNFVIDNPSDSSFLRVLNGDGGASPYLLVDVYGLQGVGTVNSGLNNFSLNNDIDASGTALWDSLAAPVLGTIDEGFVPLNHGGIFDGQGFDITGLFSRRYLNTPGSSAAGLFDENSGLIQHVNIIGADIAGVTAGIVAASNSNIIEGVSVSGTIVGYTEFGGTAVAGGITGSNSNQIVGSITNVNISDAFDPTSFGGSSGPAGAEFGGIAGANIIGGIVDQSETAGNISFTIADQGIVGGVVGRNTSTISNSYALAAVSGDTTGGFRNGDIGGIAGSNTGLVFNSLANNQVSVIGPNTGGTIGTIVGFDDPSPTNITSTYFNSDQNGVLASGQNGEVDAGPPGPFEGARGLTLVELQTAQDFFDDADDAGWDFLTLWSLPQNGSDHARLYATDAVVSAFGEDPDPSFVYSGSTTGFTINGDYGGGPAVYLFDDAADTGTVTDLNSQITLSDANVGLRTYTFPTSFTSDLGQVYEVRQLAPTANVTPAPLTVTVNDATKPFGNTLTFADVSFSAATLFGSDAITGGTVVSTGAPSTAPADTYALSLDPLSLTGPGMTNYTISVVPGTLTVNEVALQNLDILVNDAFKTYGETLLFAGTEFTTVGLASGDSVDSLTLSSDGAAATAQVADGPFAINGSDPVGSGLGNYNLTITPGTLTIIPAPLSITADDQTKPRGDEFTFSGTEFSVVGLLNADEVTQATLSSTAAGADAPLTGDGPADAIFISDPQGSGLDNYEITVVNGVFIVAPGNLTITALDQTKTYGSVFSFNGTEFTVAGLAEGDSVDSVTLTSAGAAGTAQVADGPFTITASDAVGTGLEKYTLVFADGSFTVTPAPLTVTAQDQTKQQGQAFTFNGTEFTTTGLFNDDTVTNVGLSSDGAAADATTDDSPFVITVGDVNGSGLDNYDISTVNGSFIVQNTIAPPAITPPPGGGTTVFNPRDNINISFPDGDGDGGIQTNRGTGGPTQTLQQAEETGAIVDTISTELEQQVQSCGSADQDFDNYMTCLSASLDTYSNALDQISNDLPNGLETVSATIRTASDEIKAAAARAQRRLATATTDAQRRAIRSDAVNEARGAIDTAKSEIRKAISLIRADDPEVTAVQRNTGARIVQAFDTVETSLVRAVEL